MIEAVSNCRILSMTEFDLKQLFIVTHLKIAPVKKLRKNQVLFYLVVLKV